MLIAGTQNTLYFGLEGLNKCAYGKPAGSFLLRESRRYRKFYFFPRTKVKS